MAASLWWDDSETSNTASQEKTNEILVFGYACKLFRDDEKALAIEKGRSLIPWMGDDNLMIDRYDGRGHLYDLALHDADNISKSAGVMSEEEEAVEKACDEERYLELHTDVREAEMYEEEEWKRYYLSLQEGYQAVGFGYDQTSQQEDPNQWPPQKEPEKAEELKPFVPPAELQVPADVKIPSCQRQNARIEKTAKFIAQHGIQMEIMIKAKQSGNSQFEFLQFDSELNAYYKHMVAMIKSGKYKPADQEEEAEANDDASASDNYLHPSLSLPPPPPKPSKPIELPKVSIHDTPYGALINSIRKNTEKMKPKKEAPSEAQTLPAIAPDSSGHTHPSLPSASDYQHPNNPPPPGTEPVTLPMVSALNGPAFVEELYGGNDSKDSGSDRRSSKRRKEKRRRKRSSSSDSSSSSSSGSTSSSSSRSKSASKKRKSSISPPKMHGPAAIIPPPPDMLPIVDRMAMYVAKNGAEFEIVVMNRKDPRFQFLNEYHAFYPYYKLKKEAFMKELEEKVKEEEQSNNANNQRSISFSIKSRPKEQEGSQPAAKHKPRLFAYDSSEGEEGKEERPVQETLIEGGYLTPPPPPSVAMDEDSQSRELEEKLKDKLANAVKERLSQTNKERQLQQERKKKAAMFLNLIKGSQPSSSSPGPPEDASSLYVGEGSASPVVYEYNNSQTPQVEERSKSPKSKHRKRSRRSPTPPSAYSLDRRPGARASPPKWTNRQMPWAMSRDRSPAQSYSGSSIRARSRSPHRKEEKKKHQKHSKSRSPSHTEKSRDYSSSRQSKEKSKRKSKDYDKKRKDRSKHRGRDSDSSESRRATDLIDKLPTRTTDILWNRPRSKNGGVAANGASPGTQDIGSIPVPAASNIGGRDSPLVLSSRGSTPGRTTTDSTGVSTSSDLMSKVRAMLKKSREMEDSLDGLETG